MDNSFSKLIETAKSILILLPSRPVFDNVAAGLSLYLALKDKKECVISCPSEMTVEFNRLVGIDKVTTEFGNKNLVIRFADYLASGIERVSYDVENGEFKLTIIPKEGILPPGKDQVLLAHSGISADTVVLVGGMNDSDYPILSSKDLEVAKKIHLGTKGFQGNGEIISLARPASTVSELTGLYLKEYGINFNQDMASNLIQGIEVGTNNFTSPEVSADTFQILADLMRAGGKRRAKEIDKQMFPAGSIPGQLEEEVIMEEPQEAPKEWTTPKIFKGTSSV